MIMKQMTAHGSGVIPSEETVPFFPLRTLNLVPKTHAVQNMAPFILYCINV